MQYDESFGIIPLRKTASGWEVFLIQHRTSLYWGFPKGHAEPGETPQACALRELREETNLVVVHFLSKEPLIEEFVFEKAGKKVFKKVQYFLAEIAGESRITDAQEVVQIMCIGVTQAASIMTHASGKALCQKLQELAY